MTTRSVRSMGSVVALGSVIAWSSVAAATGAAPTKRALEAADFDRLLEIDGIACSRDGGWVAYMVEGADLEADDRKSSVWMVNSKGHRTFD